MLQLLRRMMNVMVERQFDGTNRISLFCPMDVREKGAAGGSKGLQADRENESTVQSKSCSMRCAHDVPLGIELDVRRYKRFDYAS